MEPTQPNQLPGERRPNDESGAPSTADSRTGVRGGSHTGSRTDSSNLGRQLGGDLPCIVCGYNLKGLSIRGVCPECGTTVRAAILAVVDPQARVLQPIRRPRLVAFAVVAWMAGGLAAALLCWLPHAVDLLGVAGVRNVALPPLRHAVLGALAVSGVGAAVLVRPHAKIPAWHSAAAAMAALLYVPLVYLLNIVMLQHDLRIARPILTNWQPLWSGTVDVGVTAGLIAAILMLLRPIARLLVARSLLMRSGRVDRQTLWAMAAAAIVIAVGQVVGNAAFAEGRGGLLGTIGVTLGVVLMVIGAILLTIGLAGGLIDAIRIARAVVRPRHTFKQVVRGGVKPSSTVR